MARGRKPSPGKVYYLGRLRFRPGADPPEGVLLRGQDVEPGYGRVFAVAGIKDVIARQ